MNINIMRYLDNIKDVEMRGSFLTSNKNVECFLR